MYNEDMGQVEKENSTANSNRQDVVVALYTMLSSILIILSIPAIMPTYLTPLLTQQNETSRTTTATPIPTLILTPTLTPTPTPWLYTGDPLEEYSMLVRNIPLPLSAKLEKSVKTYEIKYNLTPEDKNAEAVSQAIKKALKALGAVDVSKYLDKQGSFQGSFSVIPPQVYKLPDGTITTFELGFAEALGGEAGGQSWLTLSIETNLDIKDFYNLSFPTVSLDEHREYYFLINEPVSANDLKQFYSEKMRLLDWDNESYTVSENQITLRSNDMPLSLCEDTFGPQFFTNGAARVKPCGQYMGVYIEEEGPPIKFLISSSIRLTK